MIDSKKGDSVKYIPSHVHGDEKHGYNVPVCTVGDKSCYVGTEAEAVAMRLEEGDKITFNGVEETVDYVWVYEGLVIKLKSGGSVFPALGNVFELVPISEEV